MIMNANESQCTVALAFVHTDKNMVRQDEHHSCMKSPVENTTYAKCHHRND
jgi:hypothetical protein